VIRLRPASAALDPTNRDVRTAGRHAIVAWERDGRIRVSVRDVR
jgi:hypothetical protein